LSGVSRFGGGRRRTEFGFQPQRPEEEHPVKAINVFKLTALAAAVLAAPAALAQQITLCIISCRPHRARR